MKYAALALVLLASPAFAAAPAQAPLDPNKVVTIAIPVKDVQAILSSLTDSATISAREANRIANEIGTQAQAQLAPAKK